MKKLLNDLKGKYIDAIRRVGALVEPIHDQGEAVKKASKALSNCMYYDHAECMLTMHKESDRMSELQAEKNAIVTSVKDAAEETRVQVRQLINKSVEVKAEAVNPAEVCLILTGLYTDDQIRGLADKYSDNVSMLRVISKYADQRDGLKELSARIDDRNGRNITNALNRLIGIGDQAVTKAGIYHAEGSVAEDQVRGYTEAADGLISDIVGFMNVIQCQN